MKLLTFLVVAMLLANCSRSNQNTYVNMNVASPTMMERKYIKDKKQVAQCFIENVEYFRKFHRHDFELFANSPDNLRKKYNAYYNKYPGADRDPANFFEPYATRFSLKEDKYVTSPIPTNEQLTITTDSIIYNKDSLFCVAFLILNLHYDTSRGLEQKRDEGSNYSAKAIIGYRSNIKKNFNIYPLKKHSVIGFDSYEAASNMLKDLYLSKLKGKGSAGSVYEGKQFNQNVGDKDFFEKSPYFQSHENGPFNFQMYRYLGKDYAFHYLSCE